MNNKTVIQKLSEDSYSSACGITMRREYGVTPNGNPIRGRWVLRKDGKFVDYDQYQTDLVERHNLEFERKRPD